MKNKKAAAAGLLCLMMLGTSVRVQAGDVNAAEQAIVNYYNGTVQYAGKTYRFTEAAKAQAYNKLVQDDVNLTEQEAASAIRQANLNLQQGIDGGYMEEVQDSTTEEPPQENGSGKTEAPSGTPTEQNPNENNDGLTGQNPTDSNNGTLAGQNPSDSNNGAQTGETPSENVPLFPNVSVEENKPQNSEERKQYKDTKKTDLSNLLEQTLAEGEHASVSGQTAAGKPDGESEWIFTVEQQIAGKLTAVSEHGDVLLATDLPIKNTGYHTGKKNFPAAVLCLVIGVGLAFLLKKSSLRFFVLYAAGGLTVFFLFLEGNMLSRVGEWNALFVKGAPAFAYEEIKNQNAETKKMSAEQRLPLNGEQYGELFFVESKESIPLYYGDSDEILEKGAGTYTGGGISGEGKTILIGGHDTTYFKGLEELQKGTELSVQTAYGTYRYEVTDTEVLDVSECQNMEMSENGEELVLYTCYPFGKTDGLRTERYFVYAKKCSDSALSEKDTDSENKANAEQKSKSAQEVSVEQKADSNKSDVKQQEDVEEQANAKKSIEVKQKSDNEQTANVEQKTDGKNTSDVKQENVKQQANDKKNIDEKQKSDNERAANVEQKLDSGKEA